MTSRHYCFTINNPTEEDNKQLNEIECKYLVWGEEVGENNTPHYQGYIEMTKSIRAAGLSKLLTRAHIEKRLGTREQARDYCMKDGKSHERGNWGIKQGYRSDLHKIMEMVKDHTPMIEIMEEMPEVTARNLRWVEKYQSLVDREQTKEFRDVTVEVHWGQAGTGKTRHCTEQTKDLFIVNSHETFPFNDYQGESAILIDDFDGSGFRYTEFLRVCDGHQYRANTKGGCRYARWTKIYITSNTPPHAWYQRGFTPALERRITSVTEYTDTK